MCVSLQGDQDSSSEDLIDELVGEFALGVPWFQSPKFRLLFEATAKQVMGNVKQTAKLLSKHGHLFSFHGRAPF